jgi:hypothetical protein
VIFAVSTVTNDAKLKQIQRPSKGFGIAVHKLCLGLIEIMHIRFIKALHDGSSE